MKKTVSIRSSQRLMLINTSARKWVLTMYRGLMLGLWQKLFIPQLKRKLLNILSIFQPKKVGRQQDEQLIIVLRHLAVRLKLP